METCVIESPYAGEVERNLKYLDRCILYCVYNNLAPYASHKMMTTALNDDDPIERKLGIDCGFAFRRLLHRRLFFVDYGWSNGMKAAQSLYDVEGISYEIISIGLNP